MGTSNILMYCVAFSCKAISDGFMLAAYAVGSYNHTPTIPPRG